MVNINCQENKYKKAYFKGTMMNVKEILDELNLENGSNYKIKTLKKYQDNELLKRVLKMAFDKVAFTYGVTNKNVKFNPNKRNVYTLDMALDFLAEKLATREITGNNAIYNLENIYEHLSVDDAKVLKMVIDRDLKINMGRTNINKVFKNLITKPPYTRCEIGTKENIIKNIDFSKKVYSQEKLDGTFRRAIIDGDNIEITSRPGIVTEFPIIENQIRTLNLDGYVLIGEMTLIGEKDRKKGNGLINSLKIPHENILYTVWDMIPIQEFRLTKAEIKKAEKEKTLSYYEDRFEKLENILSNANLPNIRLVPYRIISNMSEAYKHFQEITKDGGEGTVIKSYDMTHKDGNSKKQLKVKLVIELDMRITGFTKGTVGSKNEDYFSGIEYSNDEGTIKGTVGVTTLTEEERDWFHENRESLLGRVMTLHCNDITQAKGKDYHSLSHPRYIELRTKNETDSLVRALEIKDLAMELS